MDPSTLINVDGIVCGEASLFGISGQAHSLPSPFRIVWDGDFPLTGGSKIRASFNKSKFCDGNILKQSLCRSRFPDP